MSTALRGPLLATSAFRSLRQLRVSLTTGPFGTVLKASEYIDGGVPLINPAHIQDGRFIPDRTVSVTESMAAHLSRHMLAEGDLVVGRKGDVGRSAVVTAAEDGWLCGSDSIAIRVDQSIVLPHYLQWVLAERAVREQLTAASNGATMASISEPILLALRVPYHDLATQRAIADYLDREAALIDALIAAKRRMVELIDERWQVVIHDAASGLLSNCGGERRETAIPWLVTVPSHWREALLKLVANLGTGHTPSRSHPEWWADLTIPWITTGEVAQMRTDRIEYITRTRERISKLGMANSSATLHPAGTVVLCRTASAGYSAIMGSDMATSQDFATWTCGPLLRPRYLLLCLRAMRQDLLGRLAMGSTHKTIYMPDIESIAVPLPPVAEQDELVSAAYAEQEKLDAVRSRLTEQLDLLGDRRQALITAAVTGSVAMPE